MINISQTKIRRLRSYEKNHGNNNFSTLEPLAIQMKAICERSKSPTCSTEELCKLIDATVKIIDSLS